MKHIYPKLVLLHHLYAIPLTQIGKRSNSGFCRESILTLALWVKFSADYKLKYFLISYFSQKTGFDISSKLSLDNLLEMSYPVLCKKKKKKKKMSISGLLN